MNQITKKSFAGHPCFSPDHADSAVRVHLPVAGRCNIQCNYCNRAYDCVNESRPGVTSSVLTPGQAHYYMEQMSRKMDISVVGIAGPGDPFADPDLTLRTLKLVRRSFPDITLCVSTNGLNLLSSIPVLVTAGVSHVTLTINAVDEQVGAGIYRWIRVNKRVFRGKEAASLLLQAQLAALASLRDHGITVKINTIIIPGVNDHHAVQVAKETARRGADIQNCIPMIPVDGAEFEDMSEPAPDMMKKIRQECGEYLVQMSHCQRCRADAAGLIGEKDPAAWIPELKQAAGMPMNPAENRPYVAVASREGFLVNQHLGEMDQILIYGMGEDNKMYLADKRPAPGKGGGDTRWEKLAATLHDCRAVLVQGAGIRPVAMLEEAGIHVHMVEGLIDDAVNRVFAGVPLTDMSCRTFSCSSGCTGTGGGCG